MPLRGGRTWHVTDLVSVIDRFDAMWNAQDIDAVIESFSDDAMVIVVRSGHDRPKVVVGRDQIRDTFRTWLPGSTIRSRSHYVDGGRVIWVCVASRHDDHSEGSDEVTVKCEAVVRGDEIAMLTVWLIGQSESKLVRHSRHHRGKNWESGLTGSGKAFLTLNDGPTSGIHSL